MLWSYSSTDHHRQAAKDRPSSVTHAIVRSNLSLSKYFDGYPRHIRRFVSSLIVNKPPLWHCRSERNQRAAQLALTRDELAAQSAAAARGQAEADRLGRELGRTAEQLAAALTEDDALRRQLAAEEDRRATAQDDLQVAVPTRVRHMILCDYDAAQECVSQYGYEHAMTGSAPLTITTIYKQRQ